MSISSIDNEIALYYKKIAENKTFISNTQTLIGNATKSSAGLKSTSESLGQGLIIDGKSADQGKLAELSGRLDSNIGKLSSAISTSNELIVTYEEKIKSLQAQRSALVAEEARKKAQAAASARKKSTEPITKKDSGVYNRWNLK